MLTDISTVVWKEWKELLALGGTFRGGRLGLLLFAAVFGVYLPLTFGPEWVSSPLTLAYWAWVPLMLVAGVVADSFAGERERHTLETLLASRLYDRAILLGKVAAAVSYGWGTTLALLLVGLVTLNVAHGRGELLIYSPLVGFGIVAFTLLGSLLVASVGVLISLRASTVRQAAQTLSIALMLLIFVPVFGSQLLPGEVQRTVVETIAGVDLAVLVFGVLAALAAVDFAMLLLAMARFQRSRLILA